MIQDQADFLGFDNTAALFKELGTRIRDVLSELKKTIKQAKEYIEKYQVQLQP